MTLFRLQLMDGVDPGHTASVLRELVHESESIMLAGLQPEVLQQRFLDWSDRSETQLHHLTDDLEALGMSDTARARMIRELGPHTARPWPLIDAEVKFRVAIFKRMLADLEHRIERAKGLPGEVVVIDTNVLLHYRPLNELPWSQLVGSRAVRAVLPLRVIEELDAKKYSGRKDLARRARRLLPQLNAWIGPAGTPKSITENLTLEVMIDSGPRHRPADADEEILLSCRELAQFGASAVTLLTADTAMSLRAQAEGITVASLAEEFLRNSQGEQ